MSQQDDTTLDLGLDPMALMALILMRAVSFSRNILLPGGERIKRCNMILTSGLGHSIDVELPATDEVEMAVERIRLVGITSGDEFNGTVVIVLYGVIFSPSQRACLILSSQADVSAFKRVLQNAGTEDYRLTTSFVGRVAPQACLCDTPEMQGGPHQLMFSDTGDFMSNVTDPLARIPVEN